MDRKDTKGITRVAKGKEILGANKLAQKRAESMKKHTLNWLA